jgi:nicotinamide riboside transporter PnuC
MKLVDLAWLLSAISILGALWNIRKRKSCFIIWNIGNVGWLVLGIFVAEYRGQIPLWIVFTALNTYGWFQWRKDENSKHN